MPEFFDVSDVLDFHFEQIELYGGSHGVRDMGMLESALAMPMSGFEDNYLHAFPFEMAAAYLFHIVQNHPFIDGNKRTGLATCLYFLGLHGIEVVADPDRLASFVLSVAEGNLGKPQIAAFLECHARKTE
jgi:death-on-curing protein